MPRFTNATSPFSPNYFGAEREDAPKEPLQGFGEDGSYDTTGYSKGNTPEEEDRAKANLRQLSQKIGFSSKQKFSKNSIFYQPPTKDTSHDSTAEQSQKKLHDSYSNSGNQQEEPKLHEQRITSSYPDLEKPQNGKVRGFFRKQEKKKGDK